MPLSSGIQTYQILTNDGEVCIPSLSSILLAVMTKNISDWNSKTCDACMIACVSAVFSLVWSAWKSYKYWWSHTCLCHSISMKRTVYSNNHRFSAERDQKRASLNIFYQIDFDSALILSHLLKSEPTSEKSPKQTNIDKRWEQWQVWQLRHFCCSRQLCTFLMLLKATQGFVLLTVPMR